MSKRTPSPPPVTPMRLQMLRDARDHGNAVHTVRHARATGVTRAVRILCEAGYLEHGTGALTPKGAELLAALERERAA